MSSCSSPAGANAELLRQVMSSLPVVAAGLKRAGVPETLKPLFQSSDLGPRHISVLATLVADGPATVGELATRLGVTLTTASLMVTQLEGHGMVERTPDPQDRRRRVVAIEHSRTADVEVWLEARAEPVRLALAQLSVDERAAFVRGLRLLADELNRPPSRQPAAN